LSTEWHIETGVSREETEAFLARYEPWRIGVTFSNGARAADFKTVEPFTTHPLGKLGVIEKSIPTKALAGRVLDIGFNCGHNSIEVRRRYGGQVVGIDFNPRHKLVAGWIADASGLGGFDFRTGDAESFEEPNSFTAILHLGTLYHLPNPLRSIQNCANSLCKDGWLALETTAYVGEGCENGLNKFIYGFKGDKTNFWALSKQTLEEFMRIAGLTDIKLVKEVKVAYVGDEMSRVIYVARKA